MARVLVTAAGDDIGIGAIQSLHKASYETVAVDMNPNAAGLHIANHGECVPAASDDDWPSKIIKIVDKYGVDVIIPLIDQELLQIRRLQSMLNEDVPIIIPKLELIHKCLDKKIMYEYFEKCGLNIPVTKFVDSMDLLMESFNSDALKVLKPRFGQGGKGINLIQSDDDIHDHISESKVESEGVLIQDYIQGTEYTSNLAATKQNRLLSIVTKKVKQRQGFTAIGVTTKNSVIYEACIRAFDSLSPAGPMNVQHIIADDGTSYLIEINSRFSGTSCLNVEAGINEFDLLIRDALGEKVDPISDYEIGLNIIRYTDQLYVQESELKSRVDD